MNLNNHDNIGIEIIRLIVVKKKQAQSQVEKLFSLITTQTESLTQKRDLIELVEKILIYKFTNYSKEELDKMFTLTDFKKTRFYQDTFAEGKLESKLESIPNLIKLGLTPEQVAIALNLDLELVKKFSQSNQN